jgi:hypothetical protein
MCSPTTRELSSSAIDRDFLLLLRSAGEKRELLANICIHHGLTIFSAIPENPQDGVSEVDELRASDSRSEWLSFLKTVSLYSPPYFYREEDFYSRAASRPLP